MEVWVRAQNKKVLVAATNFCIELKSYNAVFQIIASDFTVGDYETEEEAIEVLEEIESHIESLNTPSGWAEPKVFQMPEKGFLNKKAQA